MLIGVELVRDRETPEPAAVDAAELTERMKDRRILLSTDGLLHNVIKMKPPMVLTEDDVDMTARAFDDAPSRWSAADECGAILTTACRRASR